MSTPVGSSSIAPRIAILTDGRPKQRDLDAEDGPVYRTGGKKQLYADAVTDSGGRAIWLWDDGTPPERLLAGVDGLLITGGPDLDPAMYGQKPDPRANLKMAPRGYDAWQKSMLEAALKLKLPIRGICRGMQLLNVLKGGTLLQDILVSEHDPWPVRVAHIDTAQDALHPIFMKAGSAIANVFGKLQVGVNSAHHQAIHKLGRGLVATARADDTLIEAIELADDPRVVGVQFHPERFTPEYRRIFFDHFMQEARHFSAHRIGSNEPKPLGCDTGTVGEGRPSPGTVEAPPSQVDGSASVSLEAPAAKVSFASSQRPAAYSDVAAVLSKNAQRQFKALEKEREWRGARVALKETCQSIIDDPKATDDDKSLARIARVIAGQVLPDRDAARFEFQIVAAIGQATPGSIGHVLAAAVKSLTTPDGTVEWTSTRRALKVGFQELIDHPDVSADEKALCGLGIRFADLQIDHPEAIAICRQVAQTLMDGSAEPLSRTLARVTAEAVRIVNPGASRSIMARGFEAIRDNPTSSADEKRTAEKGIAACQRPYDPVAVRVREEALKQLLS